MKRDRPCLANLIARGVSKRRRWWARGQFSNRTGELIGQFVEKRLRVHQVGGIESLGKPVVDVGEHRTALVAASSILQHPREADRARTVSVSQFVPSMSYLHAQIEFNRGT
jgi:hypothetical protein